MQENIDFGTKKTTVPIDINGSQKTVVEKYVKNQVAGNSKEYYELRRRVNNGLEEAAQYHQFSKEYHADKTMLDPIIRIEGKDDQNPYYDVVLCFTRILPKSI